MRRYSLEASQQGTSNKYLQLNLLWRNAQNDDLLSQNRDGQMVFFLENLQFSAHLTILLGSK